MHNPEELNMPQLPCGLLLRTRQQEPQLLLGPFTQCRNVPSGQMGFLMHPEIGLQWHLAFCDEFAHLLEQADHLCPIVSRPIREIQLAAPAIHMIDNVPGDGCQVAVPGPHCLVGMAAMTSTSENSTDVGRNFQSGADGAGWVERGIRSFWPQKLDKYQQRGHADEKPFSWRHGSSLIRITVPFSRGSSVVL